MSECENAPCLPWQSTIWKTGGKLIVNLFQAISHIPDQIEGQQLHYILLEKPK